MDTTHPHPVGYLLAYPEPRPALVERLRTTAIREIRRVQRHHQGQAAQAAALDITTRTLRRWISAASELSG